MKQTEAVWCLMEDLFQDAEDDGGGDLWDETGGTRGRRGAFVTARGMKSIRYILISLERVPVSKDKGSVHSVFAAPWEMSLVWT